MAIYYLSLKTKPGKNTHEVHKSNCPHLPEAKNRKHLGNFISCKAAVREAKNFVEKPNGCCYCSRLCNSAC
ncbi:hypothetical protein I0Q91_09555 [Halanaerobiaceae bacterium Z-7014]|uniref:Uncharacterized protein n=1 Tax=Halonatronomonas betaini TaxID=2778430 RepID=A0A931FA81_9FIRM|nr:hypothetical protein [Halonatronomonas betaini]MBF8437324.1 hypothetical protein [Halonatronomonas betaini]